MQASNTDLVEVEIFLSVCQAQRPLAVIRQTLQHLVEHVVIALIFCLERRKTGKVSIANICQLSTTNLPSGGGGRTNVGM